MDKLGCIPIDRPVQGTPVGVTRNSNSRLLATAAIILISQLGFGCDGQDLEEGDSAGSDSGSTMGSNTSGSGTSGAGEVDSTGSDSGSTMGSSTSGSGTNGAEEVDGSVDDGHDDCSTPGLLDAVVPVRMEQGSCSCGPATQQCLLGPADGNWGGSAAPGCFFDEATGAVISTTTIFSPPPVGMKPCSQPGAPEACACCHEAQGCSDVPESCGLEMIQSTCEAYCGTLSVCREADGAATEECRAKCETAAAIDEPQCCTAYQRLIECVSELDCEGIDDHLEGRATPCSPHVEALPSSCQHQGGRFE